MPEKKILVVEDHPLNLKLVTGLLEKDGYQVVSATDAESGIALARQERPDLILMDVQLPGLDGLAATERIRQDPLLSDTPVIALTAHAMTADAARAESAGCNSYISKPINTRTFIQEIQPYFDKQEAPVKSEGPWAARILAVDDEIQNLRVLSAKLIPQGFEVVTAGSGNEALEKVKRTRPDVVLLDIMMPGMDGYEVARRIKANPETCDTPIIMVTALDGLDDRAHAAEAGAEEFLTKPVKDKELLARIRSMLRLKQYKEQLSVREHSERVFASQATSILENPDSGANILLIEDNDKDARLITTILEERSCHVLWRKTAQEAFACLERYRVDLILLDLMLPDMDGLSVCRSLKTSQKYDNTQVIVLTSLQELDTKIEGLNLGVDDYLIKPVHARELKARCHVALRRKSYLDRLRSKYESALAAAMVDGLTGLYNRQYLEHFLPIELGKADRHGYPVSVMMLDIDNFKILNDTFGHLTGDAVLREASGLFKFSFRASDLIARYGGEEFLVVAPYADLARILPVAERLREGLARHRFTKYLPEEHAGLTVSIGLAVYPEHGQTVADLIREADNALYQAKENGKNQVCVSCGSDVVPTSRKESETR